MREKIRIKLRSYDHRLLNDSVQLIVDMAERTGAKVVGPIPLPTERKVWCVNRSPHVDKRSMEHFELRIHKRLIEILEPPQQTIDMLVNLDLPTGVDVEVKAS